MIFYQTQFLALIVNIVIIGKLHVEAKTSINFHLAKAICTQTSSYRNTNRIQEALNDRTKYPQSLPSNGEGSPSSCKALVWNLCSTLPGCKKFTSKSCSPSATSTDDPNSDNTGLTIIVTLKDKPHQLLDQIISRPFTTRSERVLTVMKELTKHARNSQTKIMEILKSKKLRSPASNIQIQSVWISNQIFVRSLSLNQVKELLKDNSDVLEIREELVIPLIVKENARNMPTPTSSSEKQKQGAEPEVQWGIKHVQADKLWAMNITGEGVLVANIDSGVLGTHEALRDNFLGFENFGWYDAFDTNSSEAPFNPSGSAHGTHTMGILAGRTRGIGVAPGAQWMACKACNESCRESSIITCGQFMSCPGANPAENNNVNNCGSAPHIVSVSIGRKNNQFWVGEVTYFHDVLKCWKANGIIPVFSAGNEGPDCQTITYPGTHPDVITIGSMNENNTLVQDSSRGPTFFGNLTKPDFVAPGFKIISAGSGSDVEYFELSGTSMATPLVAGVIALLMSAKPELKGDIGAIRNALVQGVEGAEIGKIGFDCEDSSVADNPNSYFGYGRINAYRSFQSLKIDPEC